MPDYYEAGSIVEYQGKPHKVMGVSFRYEDGVQKLNGHDLQPVEGGRIVNLVPLGNLKLISPPPSRPSAEVPGPPAKPGSPPPPPDNSAAAVAARGYYERGAFVEYQGKAYEVWGASFRYEDGVQKLNGHVLQPVGGAIRQFGAPWRLETDFPAGGPDHGSSGDSHPGKGGQ